MGLLYIYFYHRRILETAQFLYRNGQSPFRQACNTLANEAISMEEVRGVQRVLVGKPEGKRPLGRPRRRWEDNIKMDLQEVGGGRGD